MKRFAFGCVLAAFAASPAFSDTFDRTPIFGQSSTTGRLGVRVGPNTFQPIGSGSSLTFLSAGSGLVAGQCLQLDGAGNAVTSGAACGTGSGGGGGAAPISLDVRTVGMAPGGADNSPSFSALLDAIWPANSSNAGRGQGYQVDFPPTLGSRLNPYYFSQPQSWTRGAQINCPGSTGIGGGSIALVFAPGVDGIRQELNTTAQQPNPNNTYSEMDVRGCTLVSMGRGTASSTAGSPTLTAAVFAGYPGLPQPTWSPGDGILAFQGGQTFNTHLGHFGGSTGALTYTVDSLSGGGGNQKLPNIGDTLIPLALNQRVPDTRVVGLITDNGGAGNVYSVNKSPASGTTPTTSISVSAMQNQPLPVLPPGAYIDSVSGNTLTLHAGFEPVEPTVAQGFSGGLATYQLPAVQAYTVNCTAGSPTFSVVSGPSADPNRRLAASDLVWSECFPYGTLVRGPVSAGSSNYVASTSLPSSLSNQNATVTGTKKLWVIPAGLKRNQQGKSHGLITLGFPIGQQTICSSSFTPGLGTNCTTSYDQEHVAFFSAYGDLYGGNNSGASTIIAPEGVSNYVADVAQLSSVGSTFVNVNSNSAERGTAPYAMMGACTYGGGDLYVNGYLGYAVLPYCVDPTLGIGARTNLGAGSNPPTIEGGGPPDLIQRQPGGYVRGTQKFGSSFGNGTYIYADPFNNNYSAIFPDVGGGIAGAAGLTNLYNPVLGTNEWCTVAAGGHVSCLMKTTPFASFANYGGFKSTDTYPDIGFNRGFLLGGYLSIGTERKYSQYPAGTPPAAARITGFRDNPQPGGTVGLLSTNSAATTYPFGPISNSSTVPDYSMATVRSGSAANTDDTGRLALVSGSVSQVFTQTYGSAPNCRAENITAPGEYVKAVETTTGVTFTDIVNASSTDTIKYWCFGRN